MYAIGELLQGRVEFSPLLPRFFVERVLSRFCFLLLDKRGRAGYRTIKLYTDLLIWSPHFPGGGRFPNV